MLKAEPASGDAMLTAGEDYHDLATLVRGKALKNGARVALRFEGRDITYGELDRETDRVANGLAASGIGPGDRVATLLLNTPEFPLLWFGLAKRAAVLVPLNTGLKGRSFGTELSDSQPKALVIDLRLWDAYEPLRAASGSRAVRGGTQPESGRSRPLPEGAPSDGSPPITPPAGTRPRARPTRGDHVHRGTTGPPKGAIIPHEKTLTTPREIGLRSRLEARIGPVHGAPVVPLQRAGDDRADGDAERCDRGVRRPIHGPDAMGDRSPHGGDPHLAADLHDHILYKQPERQSDRTHGVRSRPPPERPGGSGPTSTSSVSPSSSCTARPNAGARHS